MFVILVWVDDFVLGSVAMVCADFDWCVWLCGALHLFGFGCILTLGFALVGWVFFGFWFDAC